jgi:hypothetical protein
MNGISFASISKEYTVSHIVRKDLKIFRKKKRDHSLFLIFLLLFKCILLKVTSVSS